MQILDIKVFEALKEIPQDSLTEEEKLLYSKVQQKFRLEEDPMRNIMKLNIPFGESPYTFFYTPRPTTDEEDRKMHKFSEIFSMTPYQFLGYNCLEVDETKYNLNRVSFLNLEKNLEIIFMEMKMMII